MPANIFSFDVALVAIMFFATLVVILSPLIIIKIFSKAQDESAKMRYSCFLSAMNMFISGAFLGLAFLDLLPDVIDDMEELLGKVSEKYPLGQFLVAFGLLFMIVLDQILVYLKENQIDTRDPVSRLDRQEPQVSSSAAHALHTSRDLPKPPDEVKPAVFHIVVLFLSLATHSFVEGFVIVTQPDSKGETLAIFFPIIFHKVIVAFGLGLNGVQTDMKTFIFVLLCVFFSSMSPAGMLFGLFLEYILNLHTLDWISTIMEGFASGTFLYVVCFELLPNELYHGRYRLLKLIMLIFGFASLSTFIFMSDLFNL